MLYDIALLRQDKYPDEIFLTAVEWSSSAVCDWKVRPVEHS